MTTHHKLVSPTSTGELVGQWVGTYDAQSAGPADVVLGFFQLDGPALAATAKGAGHDLAADTETVVGIFQTSTGAIGIIEGSLANGALDATATQTTPGCTTTYAMAGTVADNTFNWTFTGTDCLGPENGNGTAQRSS